MTSSQLFGFATYLLPVMLLVFVVQFVRLRVQNLLAARPDPHLGRKAVCHLFLSLSMATGLVGLTLLSVDLMDRAFARLGQAGNPPPATKPAPAAVVPDQVPGAPLPAEPGPAPAPAPAAPVPVPAPAPPPTPWFNSVQRTAVALMLAGLLHGTLFAVLLRLYTNDRTHPAVRRAHTGTRMVFAGIIWMTADTAALVILLAEGTTDWTQLAECTGVGVVWGPVAAIQLWLLLRDRKPGPADQDG